MTWSYAGQVTVLVVSVVVIWGLLLREYLEYEKAKAAEARFRKELRILSTRNWPKPSRDVVKEIAEENYSLDGPFMLDPPDDEAA